MTLLSESFRSRVHWMTLATAACVVTAMFGGCTPSPTVLDPFSGLREARTRAQVEREASADPFPSPGDVGLK